MVDEEQARRAEKRTTEIGEMVENWFVKHGATTDQTALRHMARIARADREMEAALCAPTRRAYPNHPAVAEAHERVAGLTALIGKIECRLVVLQSEGKS